MDSAIIVDDEKYYSVIGYSPDKIIFDFSKDEKTAYKFDNKIEAERALEKLYSILNNRFNSKYLNEIIQEENNYNTMTKDSIKKEEFKNQLAEYIRYIKSKEPDNKRFKIKEYITEEEIEKWKSDGKSQDEIIEKLRTMYNAAMNNLMIAFESKEYTLPDTRQKVKGG